MEHVTWKQISIFRPIAVEEHGSRDWPYYIVPADHIEKEEYHSIVLKCTVEPDRFHALSGPDMPVDL